MPLHSLISILYHARNFLAPLALCLCLWPLALSAESLAVANTTADRARSSDRLLPPSVLSPTASNAGVGIQSSPKLAGDAEFGEQVILTRRANFEPWWLVSDAEFFFTDNVALASEGALADSYLRTGSSVHYTNRISGNLFANAALDAHALFHQKYAVLDFLLVKADAGVLYRLPSLADAFLSAGYTGYWISESDLNTEAFQNHALSLGLQKIWKPARATQIIAGLNAEYSFNAEPASPQRHEYSAYLGGKFRLTDDLSFNASYRLALYDYPNYDRQDWNHVIAFGASYDITTWARLSATVSSAWNRSSADFFRYHNLVGGLSLSLHVEF